jgi:hypothetical protein
VEVGSMRQVKLVSFNSFVKSYKKGDVVIAERNVEIHKVLKSAGIEPIYVQNRFQFARALRAANAAGIVPYVIANTSLIARGIQIQAAFTVVLTAENATDKTLTIYDSVDEVKAAGKQPVAFVDSIVAYDLLGDQVDYVKKVGENQVPLFTFDSKLAFGHLISSIFKSKQSDSEILYMQKQQPAGVVLTAEEDPTETMMKFQ